MIAGGLPMYPGGVTPRSHSSDQNLIRVTRGQTVTLRARARSHPAIGRPLALTLFRRGEVLEVHENHAGDHPLEIESHMHIESSQWNAAQVECELGGLALTSALYLEIDGEPSWSPRWIHDALVEIQRKLDGLPCPPDFLRPARSDVRGSGAPPVNSEEAGAPLSDGPRRGCPGS